MNDAQIEIMAGGMMAMLVTRIALALIAGGVWGWRWGVGLFIGCAIATRLLSKWYTRSLLKKAAQARGENYTF